MVTINCLVTDILFKIYSFVFSRRKKFIQVWNNLMIMIIKTKDVCKTPPYPHGSVSVCVIMCLPLTQTAQWVSL